MKILITRVGSVGDQCRVEFECKCGTASANWVGRPPAVGESRHVEFEIDSPLTLGKDAAETSEPTGIVVEQDRTVLVGPLTIVADDGYARMELGCGGVDLEFDGSRPAQGRQYRVTVTQLKVVDCDY